MSVVGNPGKNFLGEIEIVISSEPKVIESLNLMKIVFRSVKILEVASIMLHNTHKQCKGAKGECSCAHLLVSIFKLPLEYGLGLG